MRFLHRRRLGSHGRFGRRGWLSYRYRLGRRSGLGYNRGRSRLCHRGCGLGYRHYRPGNRHRHFVNRGCYLLYSRRRLLGIYSAGNQYCGGKKWYKKFRHNIFFEEFVKAKI